MENKTKFKPNKPIVLIGMMGVGKTTYGKKLANAIGLDFFDIDQVIENEIGHTVSWIFENAGEDKFRKMEENKIRELVLSGKNNVIALGGGAFLNDTSREIIKNNAYSIWLKTSAEIIHGRVKIRKDRPLLENTDDKLFAIKKLLEERNPIYSKADIEINTEGRSHKDVVSSILNKLIENRS